nr:metallophosphoesterase [uncultured Intestinibacter sp.]
MKTIKQYKKHTSILLVTILISITGYTAYFINKNININQSFIVDKKDLYFSKLPSNFQDYKILQITDLHSMEFDKDNKTLIYTIDKLSPDVIFVTGDMFSSSELKKEDNTYNRDFDEESLPGFQLLKNLSQKYEIIYSTGNHEEGIDSIFNGKDWSLRNRYKDNAYNRYINKLSNLGIKFVDNTYTTIQRGNQSINVYGIYYYFLDEYAKGNIPKGDKDLDFLNTVDKNKFNILLSHNPTGAQTLKNYEFDLVFSGHVHGGIIRFFNKGLLDPARKFFPKYNKGLYEVGNTQLFVSTGLGNTKFMRINNSPELNLITLKSK